MDGPTTTAVNLVSGVRTYMYYKLVGTEPNSDREMGPMIRIEIGNAAAAGQHAGQHASTARLHARACARML